MKKNTKLCTAGIVGIAAFAAATMTAPTAGAASTVTCANFEAAPSSANLSGFLAGISKKAGTLRITSYKTADAASGAETVVLFDGRGSSKEETTPTVDGVRGVTTTTIRTPKGAFRSVGGGKFTAVKSAPKVSLIGSAGKFSLAGLSVQPVSDNDTWVYLDGTGTSAIEIAAQAEGSGEVTSTTETVVEQGCSNVMLRFTVEHRDSDSETANLLSEEVIQVDITPGPVTAIKAPKAAKK